MGLYLNSRFYSLASSLKRFPSYALVRQLFGNNKERQEKRDKILSELRKGYLSDLKEVRTTGGKRYLAMNEPFSQQESTALPAIQGHTVSGQSVLLPQDTLGSITLLLLWTRQHGQKACDVYRNTFTMEFRTNINTKYYEVNLVESWLFRKLQSFINSNLKKQIPPERQENFMCCYEGTSKVVKTLFENTLVGHAVLLDHTGLVRWKAHGPPTEDELHCLVKCTNTLCDELTTIETSNSI